VLDVFASHPSLYRLGVDAGLGQLEAASVAERRFEKLRIFLDFPPYSAKDPIFICQEDIV
jgi:hypothetical protein